MSINFNNIQIINKLGAGMFGTVYLIKHNNKKYALKIQKVFKKDIKKDYKSEIWRELSFFKYINKLNEDEIKFFMKLYEYRFYNKCKHKQIRPKKTKNKEMLKLDKSNWCLEYITDYKGKNTLTKFLINNKVNPNLIYSFILQLCNIVLILHRGKYSHDDIHSDNLMIHKTNDEFFKLNELEVPYFGYQIVLIDYGQVKHNKFKVNKHSSDFFKKKNQWLFYHIFYNVVGFCNNLEKYIVECIKRNKKNPWKRNKNYLEDFFVLIYKNHNNFWINTKKKYIKLFPQSRKYFKLFEENFGKDLYSLLKKSDMAWFTFSRVRYEFQCKHPKLYSKYYGWCSYHNLTIPKNEYLDLLTFDNINQLINFCIEKINK